MYDAMLDRLSAEEDGIDAVDAVVHAYLDNKPRSRGRHHYSRRDRDADFWHSRLVANRSAADWSSDPSTLALSRYFGQSRVACPQLLERIAEDNPRTIIRAVRWSGLVLERPQARLAELEQIAAGNSDIAELCRVLDIFDRAFQERRAEVEHWRAQLAELSPFELLIYASLYAFEHLVTQEDPSAAHPSMESRRHTEEQWQAINDLFIWRLGTADPRDFRLAETTLGRSIQAHMAPHLFPIGDWARARSDLRSAYAAAVDAQIELNSFKSRSADAFSFDDGIEFVRKGNRLEIVELDPGARAIWLEESRRLERLHEYWFYRAIDAFFERGLATGIIGSPENHGANSLAYVCAIRTELRLREVYGLDDLIANDDGRKVPLLQALLAAELMHAFYQRDFLQGFIDNFRRLGHWAPALAELALGGLADGMQNRLPLSWTNRNAKINNIVGWTVSDEHPRGSRAAGGDPGFLDQ